MLYFDTESVIFTQKENEWTPPIGDFLGNLTDEMIEYGDGSNITEFVSGGPKNYAYKFWSTKDRSFKTVCKVKGLSLHYNNAQIINFDVIKSMICGDVMFEKIEVCDRIIVRDPFYNVLTKNQSKSYSIQYTKRRRLTNSYDTLPYGFL